jgi:eukaryotic-like serine/threonine-protein kinase
VVYVGSQDNNIYALDANTGSLLWKYTTGGPVPSSPATANGVVYVGSNDYALYALSAKTGVLLWSYGTANEVSSPVVANGKVYVFAFGADVYAFGLPRGGWGAKQGAVSKPPALNTLRPDFNLKVSKR